MKIVNYGTQQYNNKTNTAKTKPFKGYFACPIKELHIQPTHDDENAIILLKELKKNAGNISKL